MTISGKETLGLLLTMRINQNNVFLALFLCLIMNFTHAIDSGLAFSDPKLQQRYETLISEIRCLVCQNQSIKSSNVFLAVDLRNEVRIMISEGKSNKEIANFLADRYGEFVLYRPRFKTNTIFLWLSPFVFLMIGLFVAYKVVRKKIIT